jgi:hypothetical protein
MAQKYIATLISFFSNSLENVIVLSNMQKEKDGAVGI